MQFDVSFDNVVFNLTVSPRCTNCSCLLIIVFCNYLCCPVPRRTSSFVMCSRNVLKNQCTLLLIYLTRYLHCPCVTPIYQCKSHITHEDSGRGYVLECFLCYCNHLLD